MHEGRRLPVAELGTPGGAVLAVLAVLAVVAVVALLIAFVPAVRQHARKVYLAFDGEVVAGLATIALVAGSVALLVGMGFWSGGQPAARVGVVVVVSAVALLVASTQWARPTVRWYGALTAVLLVGLVFGIGRTQLVIDPAERAGIAADDARATVAAIHADVEGLGRARDAAITALDGKIKAIGSTSPTLSAAAGEVRVALGAATSAELMTRLKAPRASFAAAYHEGTASDAEKALKQAMDHATEAASKALTGAEASPQEADEAIGRVCALVRAAVPEGDVCIGADATTSGMSGPAAPSAVDTMEVAVATMRLRVATYQQAALQRDQDEVAVKRLHEELAAAQASATRQPPSASVLATIQRGGNAVLESLVGAHDPAVVPDTFGWAVIALLLVLLWNVVERRSATRMLGPVRIADFTGVEPPAAAAPAAPVAGGSTGVPAVALVEGAAQQKTVFRTALLQNLPPVPTIPGASTLDSLSDLAELAGPVGGPLAKAALRLKESVIKTGGCTVSAEVISPTSDQPKWRVQVSILDGWTGEQLAVDTLSGTSAVVASSAAGYWAAAVLLARSPRVASWEQWDRKSSEALAALRHGPPFEVEHLAAAVAKAPGSGLLLVTLGRELERAGDHRKALELHARAVALHPNFFAARYRLALVAWVVSRSIDAQWSNVARSDRTRIAAELQRALRAMGVRPELVPGLDLGPLPSKSGTDAADAFALIAHTIFGRLQTNSSRVRTLARALRRSERDAWLPLARSVGPFGLVSRSKWLARSARVGVTWTDHPLDQDELDRVTRKAAQARSWWQLSYNLACIHTKVGNAAEACRWLEIALERPGSWQLGGVWIEQDPDLAPLHDLARFRWVVDQLKVTGGSDDG